MAAVVNGSVDVVNELVLLGAPLEARDASGRTALFHAAASSGRVRLVAYLVSNGANVGARDAVDEKVSALDLGADDYVTKPFDTEELLARLRVALRHQGRSAAAATVIARGDLTIDLDRRIVRRGAGDLHLTRKEYDVLVVLARHMGRVVTHNQILAAAWGGEEDRRIEYLRIVIRNLRQKLESPGPVGSVIANELGVGYRLRAED